MSVRLTEVLYSMLFRSMLHPMLNSFAGMTLAVQYVLPSKDGPGVYFSN